MASAWLFTWAHCNSQQEVGGDVNKHLQTNQVLPTARGTCLGVSLRVRLSKTWKHSMGRH